MLLAQWHTAFSFTGVAQFYTAQELLASSPPDLMGIKQIMNIKEITLQQCGFLMLYDCY